MMPEKKVLQDKSFTEEVTAVLSGVFVFANGDRYDGEYTNLEDGSIIRHGAGDHVAVNGITYKGMWTDDKMNGTGKIQYLSGATFEGDFVNNKMHGYGVYTFPDKSVYKGNFVDNRLRGDGEFIDSNKQQWHGMFQNKTATQLQFKLKM